MYRPATILGSLVTLVAQDESEVVEADGGVVVVAAQALLADRHGTLEQPPGASQVTLPAQDFGEVVEAGGGVGVVSAQTGLIDG